MLNSNSSKNLKFGKKGPIFLSQMNMFDHKGAGRRAQSTRLEHKASRKFWFSAKMFQFDPNGVIIISIPTRWGFSAISAVSWAVLGDFWPKMSYFNVSNSLWIWKSLNGNFENFVECKIYQVAIKPPKSPMKPPKIATWRIQILSNYSKFPISDFQNIRLLKTLKYAILIQKSPKSPK